MQLAQSGAMVLSPSYKFMGGFNLLLMRYTLH